MSNTLQVTDAAFAHIERWIKKEAGLALYIGLKTAGCSGLQYVTHILTDTAANDLETRYRVFELGSAHNPTAKIVLAIDREHWPHIQGSVIDFVKQGLQERLIFRNPNETGSCGCGESFTVDE